MINRLLIQTFFFLILILICFCLGCKRDLVTIKGIDRSALFSETDSSSNIPTDSGLPVITSVNIANNTIIISGENFNTASLVRVTNDLGFDLYSEF